MPLVLSPQVQVRAPEDKRFQGRVPEDEFHLGLMVAASGAACCDMSKLIEW